MTRLLLLCGAALAFATPLSAQTIAITGGKLVIGDGSAPIDNGTVIITNGRVTAAGKGVAVPANAQRVDASGKWVTPGIVAGFSRLGLAGVDAVDPSNDTAARGSPFNAALDIAPAVNPDVAAIAPVAAVRPPVRDEFLPPERDGARPAVAGADIDLGLVEKLHGGLMPQESGDLQAG